MKVKFTFLLLAVLVFSGCSIFSPYNSKFQCESPDKGKCVSVQKAYEESMGKGNFHGKVVGKHGSSKDKGGEKEMKDVKSSSAEESYRESIQREMANLINAPVTPLLVPPKVMRVLVLPYPDKSVLYMPRYIYIMTDKPRWIIGDYLLKKRKD